MDPNTVSEMAVRINIIYCISLMCLVLLSVPVGTAICWLIETGRRLEHYREANSLINGILLQKKPPRALMETHVTRVIAKGVEL